MIKLKDKATRHFLTHGNFNTLPWATLYPDLTKPNRTALRQNRSRHKKSGQKTKSNPRTNWRFAKRLECCPSDGHPAASSLMGRCTAVHNAEEDYTKN